MALGKGTMDALPDARYWDLAALALMLGTLFGTAALHSYVVRWMNAERDAAVVGIKQGVRISVTHRWQLFFDWVAMLTALVGAYAAVIYAVLSIAELVETESFRRFGYVLVALSGWAVFMLALVGAASDGMLMIRTLRAAKGTEKELDPT